MIKTEAVTVGTLDFTHTWSDAGMRIKQESTGILYDDAMDLTAYPQTYTETTEPIDGGGGEEEATPEEIAAALEEVI